MKSDLSHDLSYVTFDVLQLLWALNEGLNLAPCQKLPFSVEELILANKIDFFTPIPNLCMNLLQTVCANILCEDVDNNNVNRKNRKKQLNEWILLYNRSCGREWTRGDCKRRVELTWKDEIWRPFETEEEVMSRFQIELVH